ncbi:DUF3343 domain-containing protein [Desulfosporosinus sp. FKB]|uniref:DUF3343 domain-containing protein n=1 Tax=Desulfosporosinus sp. FKB TaxID=1969835 RepID=UPI000B4A1294|nr:DUF3343 domain-containing protein [Desulfosporosinus sp. FKB]
MLYGELKQYRALITFDSLTQAMAAEKVFKKLDCPYALIPTPRTLRSGCNNALCFPHERKEIIDDLIDEMVVFTGVYEANNDGFAPLKW